MEQRFDTPAEVIDNNMKAGEGKAHLPLGKMILLGIMAGAFIALGGATSSTAAHAIDNVGLARFVAGIIFPAGSWWSDCICRCENFHRQLPDRHGRGRQKMHMVDPQYRSWYINGYLIGALIIDTLVYAFRKSGTDTGGSLGACGVERGSRQGRSLLR